MSEWEPATEAEAAMREALAASDQEQYFGILARLDLVLPVSAEALAGRAPMGWGTWTTGNRTHVLAFTSTAALRLCLNDPNGSYRPMAFHELAASWPNYEWWLAVNPGLPIESYLPSWFVSQLTRGDVRLPGRTVGARARMAQSDLAAALHGRVRASAPAPQATRAAAVPAEPVPSAVFDPAGNGAPVETVEAEVIDYPPATGPAPVAARVYGTGTTYGPHAPSGPTPSSGSPATSPATSPVGEPADVGAPPYVSQRPGLGAMLAGVGGVTSFVFDPADSRRAPSSPAGPNDYGLADYGPTDYGPTDYAPTDYAPTDYATTDYATTDYGPHNYGQGGFGTSTSGSSPAGSGAAGVAAPAAPPPLDRSQVSIADVAEVDYAARPRFGAADAGEDVLSSPSGPLAKAAKRDVQDAEVVSTADAWDSGFVPANDTESNLLIAAEENNTDAFLSTLLLARVILPVPVGTPGRARARDTDFPWQIDEMDGQPFISVFTSPERLSEHRSARLGTDLSSVSLRFVQLIGAWPSEDISFAINPGSPVGATLPGSQIVALAVWAAEVGLRDEPSAEVMVAAKKNESMPSMGVAGAPANGADRATVMQRTVPHTQVPFYLERGYDRVSGFVNRASEVSHLTSPKPLYRALGLISSGSGFSEDDGEVHVVRWVAHRSDLYRLPYGGHHEAGMRAMQGWVIERPPFRGNGFAPGDTEVVSEFKVDSIRLPHGAQMWRLSKDGMETLLATFDADTTKWVAPAFGYGAPAYGGLGSAAGNGAGFATGNGTTSGGFGGGYA